MFSNRLTFGALALACIAAAGAGGYIASRQSTVETPAVAAAPLSDADRLNQPVQESEALVGDAPAQSKATDKAESTSSGAPKQAEPARRKDVATRPAPRSASSTGNRQSLPTLDRTWPSSAPARESGTPAAASVPSSEASASNAAESNKTADQATAAEPARAAEPQPVLQEVVVAASSVIGLQTETRVSSETARVEDQIEARVTRDVRVGDSIAIPAGTRAIGEVTQVERGGKFKDRARLGIRFTTLVLADGTRMSINTDTIYREGEGPGNSSAAKIGGGAVGGAILGAILGGAKGAAIGATAGAGGGAAAVQVGDRSEVTIPTGSPVTVRLLSPLTVTVEQ
jgi:hypothetical protein